MITAIPAVSADLIGDIASGISKLIPIGDTAINNAAPIVDSAIPPPTEDSPFKPIKLPDSPRANYEYKGWDTTRIFIQTITTGKADTSLIDVTIDGKKIATISSDSKLMSLPIHTYCLRYQYGTENWYNCEVQYK